MRKTIVALTGAGMSAESGISTFRDSGGLWDNYNVQDVATLEGWQRNPALVTEFYNTRRRELLAARPCGGHIALAALEERYDVRIITQNIDDLHERAGSTSVLHLHGELMKMTSSRHPNDPRQIRSLSPESPDASLRDTAADGSPLRPYIVWFGEPVPNIERAVELCALADIFLVIGTSLNVYPAAGLTGYAPPQAPIYLIDPKPVKWNQMRPFTHIQMGASRGMEEFVRMLAGQE